MWISGHLVISLWLIDLVIEQIDKSSNDDQTTR